jgi:hypothetical protein
MLLTKHMFFGVAVGVTLAATTLMVGLGRAVASQTSGEGMLRVPGLAHQSASSPFREAAMWEIAELRQPPMRQGGGIHGKPA